ncbi:unnamed protein product, partial [Darwinula stevensoni]
RRVLRVGGQGGTRPGPVEGGRDPGGIREAARSQVRGGGHRESAEMGREGGHAGRRLLSESQAFPNRRENLRSRLTRRPFRMYFLNKAPS